VNPSLYVLPGLDVKERLARQQELLRKRLGMMPGLETGMDIMLEDEDILPAHVVVKKTLEKQKSKESQVCRKYVEFSQNVPIFVNILYQ
jgi:hypothetical protein